MDALKKDFLRKELVPIKILMFLIYGGQATLYPYFTVHLKSLGVTIEHTAIIFAVQPVIALLVAPMVGMCADKIGNFKLIFSFFLIFSSITANLLLLVPPVPSNEKLIKFQMDCYSGETMRIMLLQNVSCKATPDMQNSSRLNITMKLQCDSTCNANAYNFSQVSLKKGPGDCSSYCDDSSKNDCESVKTQDMFILSFEMSEWANSRSENFLLESDMYSLLYKNITYDSFSCSCLKLKCKTTCLMESIASIKECVDPSSDEGFGVTFWMYLGFRLIVTLGIGLVNGLFDAASMAIIQKTKADVGFQRFWATVAMCVCAPISGSLVDKYDSFKPCFFMYGTLYVIAAITSLFLDLSTKLPSDNPLKNFVKLISNPEVLLLLLHILILGICWGFLENFLFWFLESELNASNLLMGLTVTVGSGTGLLMALVATWFTRKLGYVKVIIVAFIAYTVRFIGYSLAKDAYVCLIFEMMENFTVTLLTVGVTMYCTELASLEMLTTIMTLWNGLHIISGRAFGSLLGGFLIRNYGFRSTFMYFSYLSACFGIFYALMNFFWLQKWRRKHRIETDEAGSRRSSLSEEKDTETTRNQMFSSFLLNCSFDSPAIFTYSSEPLQLDFRRRAHSHVPISTSNSFRKHGIRPRHVHSFSGAKRPLSTVLEVSGDEDYQTSNDSPTVRDTAASPESKYEQVTKF